MNALEIKNLHKSFGKNKVIDDFSLTIPENTIFGFLGKNGSGKTVTMKMILGFLKADKGSIWVFGEKVKYGFTNTNRFIGYLPDVPNFYNFMTPQEYLNLCGSITNLSKKEIREKSLELLELVGLNQINKRIKGFSRGMKQRLGIAQALLSSPKLLICDEPTSALDPVGRKEILNIIRKVKKYATVIFSTHILSDVEAVCDHAVILNEGKNMLEGSIDKLKELNALHEIEIKFKSKNELEIFAKTTSISRLNLSVNDDKIVISKEQSMDEIKKTILYELYNSNIFPLEIKIKEPTIENIFMEVIGR